MTTPAPPSVTAEVYDDGPGHDRINLKIGTPHFEINVLLTFEEAARLCETALPQWVDGARRIGRAAGKPVHWSLDDGHVSILIGQDDQTWDVGVRLPASSIVDIVTELGRCRADIGSTT